LLPIDRQTRTAPRHFLLEADYIPLGRQEEIGQHTRNGL
jgi:hypothetical protein